MTEQTEERANGANRPRLDTPETPAARLGYLCGSMQGLGESPFLGTREAAGVTAAAKAVHRVILDGWEPDQALKELRESIQCPRCKGWGDLQEEHPGAWNPPACPACQGSKGRIHEN